MTALLPEDGTTLVLVRHGQSTFNAGRRFQGCSDEAKLTALGRLTAASCGEKLCAIPFDAMIVSPLQRARQTADEIVRVFRTKAGRTPETRCEALLREIHVPQWEGLSFDEIRTQFPEQFRVWESAPHLLEVPAGRYGAPARKTFHPVARLFEQARLFIQMVRVLHGGQRVLVVSHAGTIRALIATALGAPQDRFGLLQQSNGGISALHFGDGDEGAAEVLGINQTSQRAEVLPKVKGDRLGLRLVLSSGGLSWPFVANLETRGPGALAEELQDGSWPREGQAGDVVTRGASIDEAELRNFLAGLFGLEPGSAARFKPDPRAFTVLHYARPGQLPVLQAMNVEPPTH